MDSGIFSAVEEVEHLLQAPPLGAVVGGSERITLRVSEAVVVRGGELDELEHLTLGSEPLKDVGVVSAGSSLGGHLDFFHVCSVAHSGPITRVGGESFCTFSHS